MMNIKEMRTRWEASTNRHWYIGSVITYPKQDILELLDEIDRLEKENQMKGKGVQIDPDSLAQQSPYPHVDSVMTNHVEFDVD